MVAVTLEEAKAYLRVDTSDDDAVITTLISAAETFVTDVARIGVYDTEDTEEGSDIYKQAVLFTVAYLYEHRGEDNDFGGLATALRGFLFGIRGVGF